MSQRKAAAEARLEMLENWLGRGARSRKLLEILEVNISLIQNEAVRKTAQEDIEEMRRAIHEGQEALNWVIRELGLGTAGK